MSESEKPCSKCGIHPRGKGIILCKGCNNAKSQKHRDKMKKAAEDNHNPVLSYFLAKPWGQA